MLDDAATRAEVREISVGDYVLNGGEVAALVITEAVVRLLPGFMGNAESLVEESHEDGLLEYPVFTKPASWRGLDVPEVLLSGDHARIAAWRARRGGTPYRRAPARPAAAQRRPGWRRAAPVAVPADAGELFALQRACWVQEMHDNPGVEIPALHETLDDLRAWLPSWTVLVLRREGRLVGAARARREDDAWDIGRLMVAPDLQGQGLGRFLLAGIEADGARRTSRRTASSPGRGACATSACTSAPVTGCAASSSPASWCSPSPAADLVPPRAAVADSLLGLVGRRTASGATRPGSASGTCHRGYRTPPAITTGSPS